MKFSSLFFLTDLFVFLFFFFPDHLSFSQVEAEMDFVSAFRKEKGVGQPHASSPGTYEMTVIREGGSATPMALGCPSARGHRSHPGGHAGAQPWGHLLHARGGRTPTGAPQRASSHIGNTPPLLCKPPRESYETELKLGIKNSGGESDVWRHSPCSGFPSTASSRLIPSVPRAGTAGPHW